MHKCINCKREKIDKCLYIYCICGACNHCHNGYICPDNIHWYERIDPSKKDQKRYLINPKLLENIQYGIPDCNNHTFYDMYFSK
jgi:hypothetical protein